LVQSLLLVGVLQWEQGSRLAQTLRLEPKFQLGNGRDLAG
jgi:hypothetical protein